MMIQLSVSILHLKKHYPSKPPWFLPVSGIDSPFDSVLGLLLPPLPTATPSQVT